MRQVNTNERGVSDTAEVGDAANSDADGASWHNMKHSWPPTTWAWAARVDGHMDLFSIDSQLFLLLGFAPPDGEG